MHIKPPRGRRCLRDDARRSCSKAGVSAHACRAEAAAVRARGGVRRSASAAASARWATSKISLSLQTSVSYGLSVGAGFQIWAESCFAETRDPNGYLRRKRNRIPSSAASCNPIDFFPEEHLQNPLFLHPVPKGHFFKRFPTKWYTFSLFESGVRARASVWSDRTRRF